MTSIRKDTGPDTTAGSTRTDRRAFLGLGAAALASAGAVAIVGRAGFAQDGTPPANGTPGASPEASPSASPAASPAAGGEGDVTVVMVDIAFEPSEFTIAADTDVVVSLPNEGVLEHNFVIDELDIASDLVPGGESTTVTINAAAGTYEYYCSVPGHKEAGMVGTLTVE